MSAEGKDFPRDLRGLDGGRVEDQDGSERLLLFPVRSYHALWLNIREIEEEMAAPATPIEDLEMLKCALNDLRRRIAEMRQRILDHFKPRCSMPGKGHGGRHSIKVDHGAKNKVEKALSDIDAGVYDPARKSKTLQAVEAAFAFHAKFGRMPSHSELKRRGFNDQQATDAGAWFAIRAGTFSDQDSLFRPLHHEATGRPRKK